MSETMQLLTNTRMRSFRDCARKHDLQYVKGYRPVQTAEALRFGILIHKALEDYWIAVQTGGSFLSTGFDVIEKYAIDKFDAARASEMLAAYIGRWASSDIHEYEVLAVEPRFDAPLLNPETMSASRTWRLAGKIDAIVRRKSDNRVLVIEHKTTVDNVSADDADYWTKLAMDPQCSQYVVGAESLGFAVDEILYDVLGKPQQRPKLATPVAERRITKAGTLDARQREFDETPEEYQDRVREAIEENPARFIARRSIPRSESQIADFLADSWALAGSMRDAERLGRAPRNPDACDRMGRCPYWSLCSTGGKPEDYPTEFTKLDDVHPELKENA